MNENNKKSINRRRFIGTISGSAAVIGLSTIAPTISALANENAINAVSADPEDMFKKITGEHRAVFDVPHPNNIFPFAWPRVFLLTNMATGSKEKDCSVVVVLRHDAIPYAMEDRLWQKYNFGEFFKADDPATAKPSISNPFWKPKEGAFNIPGFGVVSIGINQLQASGVMFCVCEAALTVKSATMASKMQIDAAELKKDWVSGLLPGIQPVPSGLWALGRAQKKECAYIYAG
ncbi:MAG: hypothetical protein ABIU11_04070 [Chitinophagaceae bacterium]